jgi:3-deoxy-D-manno-octulosonic acid kinase
MQTLAGGDACTDFSTDFEGDMQLRRIPTADGAILYDPSRIDHPAAADFDAAALARAGRVAAQARGRGSAWFVAARPPAAGQWVLRHYRRGGLVARLTADRYLWRGAAATRSFRELELLAALERLGLPAARPVAALYCRSGLTYGADLLTVAIPGSRSLASLLDQHPGAAAWHAIGACIRRFHDAGVCHADLNAHNVLLDDAGGVHLVDFDRGSIRAPGPWRAANVARLERSLARLAAGGAPRLGAPERRALWDGYEGRRGEPGQRR